MSVKTICDKNVKGIVWKGCLGQKREEKETKEREERKKKRE